MRLHIMSRHTGRCGTRFALLGVLLATIGVGTARAQAQSVTIGGGPRLVAFALPE